MTSCAHFFAFRRHTMSSANEARDSGLGLPLSNIAALTELGMLERVLKLPQSIQVDAWLKAFAFNDAAAQQKRADLASRSVESLTRDAAEVLAYCDTVIATLLFKSPSLVLCRVQSAPYVEDSKEDTAMLRALHGALGMRSQLALALDENYMSQTKRETGIDLANSPKRKAMLFGFISVLTMQMLTMFGHVEALAMKMAKPHVMRYEAARTRIKHACRQGEISAERENVLLEALERTFEQQGMDDAAKIAAMDRLGGLRDLEDESQGEG